MRGPDDQDEAAPATPSAPADAAGDRRPDADHAAVATGEPAWRLQHTRALDGVRAVAVLLVIGTHAWFSKLPGGGIGVAVFFTLSGFLITALLLAEITDNGRLSFKNFYMRRVLRLFPALVVFVAVVYLYSQFTGVDADKTGPAAPAALFYYANWARVAGARLGMFGHTWSLAVEEQFYLIWPVILWLGYRFGRVWGVLIASVLGALASTTARIIIQSDPTPAASLRIQNGFDTQSLSIFVGCTLATVLFLGWKPRRLIIAPVAVVTIWYLYGIVIDIFKAGDAGRGAMPLLVAIGFAAVICWLVQWPRSIPARVLSLAPIAYVGRISYGLYLWHYPVNAIVARSGTKDSGMAMLVVTVLSVVVASASYFLVERPFLRLKERFRPASPPDRSPASKPQLRSPDMTS